MPLGRHRSRRRASPIPRAAGVLAVALCLVGPIAIIASGALLRVPGASATPTLDPPQHSADPNEGLDVRQPPQIDAAWFGAAPYVAPFFKNAPDLDDVMDATGQKTFVLAFIVADDACAAAWDGGHSIASDHTAPAVINAVRARGGDVMVALGGGGKGLKLGQACVDTESTAAAYQALVDRYHLRALDWDLEDPEWRDPEAVRREVAAARILKRDNPGLYVSLTLPTLQGRMAQRAVDTLEMARDVGLVPDNVSVMPFDFHATDPMGAAAVQSLDALHDQLRATFGWSADEAYARMGASLMNGRTDHGEFFRQEDFAIVTEYANEHGVGRLTYWSVNRDRQCATIDNNGKTANNCSSIEQADWEFTRVTAAFGSARAPVPPSNAATPRSSPSGERSTPRE